MESTQNVKASKELLDLVEACVTQAQNEGVTITGLSSLIKQQQKSMGLGRRQFIEKDLYRKATEEELAFKEKVFNFFLQEISPDDIQQAFGHVFLQYKETLTLYSEIICATKMLAHDKQHITMLTIRDVIWCNFSYKKYNHLLNSVSYGISCLYSIAHIKCEEGLWNRLDIFPSKCTQAKRVCNAYLEFLASNNIQ